MPASALHCAAQVQRTCGEHTACIHPLWAELQCIHSVQKYNAVHIIYDVSQVAYAHLGRRPKQGSYASRQNAVSWGCRCQARLLTRKPLTGPSLQHSLSES